MKTHVLGRVASVLTAPIVSMVMLTMFPEGALAAGAWL